MNNKNLPPKPEKLLPSHLEKKDPLPPPASPPAPPQKPITPPPASPPPANPSIASVGLSPQPSKKISFNKKTWLIILLAFFTLVGIVGAVYLAQQKTAIEPKAADNQADCEAEGHTWCGSGSCPDGWSYGEGCWSGGNCASRDTEACASHQVDDNPPDDDDYCGPDNGYNCPAGEHCLRGGQVFDQSTGLSGTCGTVTEENDCSSSCNKDGCTTDCPNTWPVSFYCRGLSGSACGELHGSFLGYGIPGGSIRYNETIDVKDKNGNTVQISPWCSTVQADSNAGDCIIVYIGDRGEWCIEDGGICGHTGRCSAEVSDQNGDGKIDENDLDWDCDNVIITPTSTPTPTPTITPTSIPYSCQCSAITLYNQNWTEIQSTDITAGQTIYIAVSGSNGYPEYEFDKGRIRVNKTAWDNNDETTQQVLGHPSQFYITYFVPANGGTFTVEGEVHLNATITDPEGAGWWR